MNISLLNYCVALRPQTILLHEIVMFTHSRDHARVGLIEKLMSDCQVVKVQNS